MHPIHQTAEHGFSQAAELYQKTRPNYPTAITAWLETELKLNTQSRVMDLGAGTGKFIAYLQQVTANIVAIEPVAAMREQLQKQYPQVTTVDAYSESIPLPTHSLDAILCAQSFHWFAQYETLTELHRLLIPHGQLGLVWNQRNTEIDWVKSIADLLSPLEGDVPRYHSYAWKQAFEQHRLFKLISTHQYEYAHIGTVEQVVSQRLLSTSFIAAMPLDQQQALKSQFEKIVSDFTGKQPQDTIEFPYITYAYHYRAVSS